MFWHQAVANNSIMLYSNKMLSDLSKTGEPLLTPRQGTYLVGFVNFISSGTSILSAKYFSRRFLLIYGHIGIGLSHILIGIFAYYGRPTLSLASMLLFVVFY